MISVSICLIICITFLIGLFFFFRWKQKRRIEELTSYLEKVNMGQGGTILTNAEDSFAHLQDEIYKTVTSLLNTREEAVRAKENYAENLANIAHQLKTPITASLISLQLMEQETENEHVLQIQKHLSRLTDLEENLLLLSQIDTGTLQLEKGVVDIYTVLNLAADNLEVIAREKEVRVEIEDNGCVEIEGDLDWTMEAFMNLIKNCMEHSPKGEAVYCSYSKNPLYTEILIQDKGNGFQKEDMFHLFERFYRGKDEKTTGIGIGLAISQAILEMENGHITARNPVEGGACFEIRIYSH